MTCRNYNEIEIDKRIHRFTWKITAGKNTRRREAKSIM